MRKLSDCSGNRPPSPQELERYLPYIVALALDEDAGTPLPVHAKMRALIRRLHPADQGPPDARRLAQRLLPLLARPAPAGTALQADLQTVVGP